MKINIGGLAKGNRQTGGKRVGYAEALTSCTNYQEHNRQKGLLDAGQIAEGNRVCQAVESTFKHVEELHRLIVSINDGRTLISINKRARYISINNGIRIISIKHETRIIQRNNGRNIL